MFLRFSFAIVFAVSAIASVATEVDARTARRVLKSGKGESPKKTKSSKDDDPPPTPPVCHGRFRMLEEGDPLQYMTDRFKDEGSMRSFIDSIGFEVDLQSGRGEKEKALSKKDCEDLMSLINTDSDEGPFDDIETYIDDSNLASIIGKDKFNALLDLHSEVVGATVPLEMIKVRYMKGNPGSNAYLEYHTDESAAENVSGKKISAVIVPLNDNSLVKEGGELYYLSEDGPVMAARDQGKAFAHSYNVVHGVAPHVGDRFTLVLHFNHDLNLEDVVGRNLTEESRDQFGLRCSVI